MTPSPTPPPKKKNNTKNNKILEIIFRILLYVFLFPNVFLLNCPEKSTVDLQNPEILLCHADAFVL